MSQRPQKDPRLVALRRFAGTLTLFNVLGHTLFGFEQSLAQPLVGLAAAYGTELCFELLEARRRRRRPRFAGGLGQLFHFLLSAHISGLAVSMLLYANDRLAPIAFAAATAIASKHLFRVAVGGGSRHVLNPSNFGIAVTLLLFPWVGIAQPYMFTENLTGAGDWLLPALIVVSGGYLNARLTRKIPLILGWLGGFALQAAGRSLATGTPLAAALMPMTGVAFLLFTFYMVTDPATTPRKPAHQAAFGAAVAAGYGALMLAHVVFGLFFALTLVAMVRGAALVVEARAAERSGTRVPVPSTAVAAGP